MDWMGQPAEGWGKLRRDGDGAPTSYHPLVDHCIDVAAVAEALLNLPTVQARLSRLAGEERFPSWLRSAMCGAALLHDLGKANRGFQGKALPPGRGAGHVAEAASLIYGRQCTRVPSALGVPNGSPLAATMTELIPAAISHHGRPIPATPDPAHDALWHSDGALDPWAILRALGEAVKRGWPEAVAPGVAVGVPMSHALVHAFAGLVQLADWIGSDVELFPYREPTDPPDRFPIARAAATRALREIGMDVTEARSNVLAGGFREWIGFDPRPAQALVANLSKPEGPSVVLLESETGSGKTEAAIAHFLSLFRDGMVDGLYFALPTRAAAVQLEGRIRRAVVNVFGPAAPPVVLAVPGYLRVDGIEGRRGGIDGTGRPLGPFEVLWQDDAQDRARHRTWAAEHTKRFLAAPIVVGTIDQALLGATVAPHAHLRGFALLRHLMVIDEVHASDAYMARLVDELLDRHVSAGGHALLLSATLGGERAETLLAGSQLARRRARAAPPPLVAARELAYPLVRRSIGGKVDLLVSPQDLAQRKQVSVEAHPIAANHDATANLVADAVAKGATVLVIRNTVADCVATQFAVESALGMSHPALLRCHGQAVPHHSRYAAPDRRALDHALEQAFGSRGPRVAVTTQTAEQSLDLDADLLITDLAPMDVLLQRIGRLHRHRNNDASRPSGFEHARTLVLTPNTPDLADALRGHGPHGVGTVYPWVSVLQRTWELLLERPSWAIPDDNRSLVEDALHSEARAALAARRGSAWAEADQRTLGEQVLARHSAADAITQSWTDEFGKARPVDDEIIHTRFSDDGPDRRCPLPPDTRSPLTGAALSELGIPSRLWKGAWPAPGPAVEVHHDHLSIFGDDIVLRYDRFGLQRQRHPT